MKPCKLAILGATGAVGQEMIALLESRNFPIKSIAFLASKRSAGKIIPFKDEDHAVKELTHDSFEGIDIVLSSAGGSISREFAPSAVKAGAVVIDNTSAFRMDPNVPLVIPEINPDMIQEHQGIIANPNCSTIVMLMALFPLDQVNRITRIQVATYQAASGAGAKAMEELHVQTEQVIQGKPIVKNAFPHQIAFNLFSHNSAVDDQGYNEEEMKMVNETHKILKRKNIQIGVTCVRVPVMRAHSEAIYVDFEKPFSPHDAREVLAKAPGVSVIDNAKDNLFPMPLDAAHQDDVFVGRIRQDLMSNKSLGLFVCGDQIRKGAALNAIQIAENLRGKNV